MSPFKAIVFILVCNIVTIACLDYPKVRRDETVEDNYNGIKVKDQYRWLEDENTAEAREYLEQQNNFSLNYLSECNQRKEFRKRLDDLKNYPKYTGLFKRGTRYFQQTKYPFKLFVRDNRESNGRDVFENLQINYTRNGVMNYNLVSRDGELVAFYVDEFNDGDYKGLSLKIFNITSQTLHPDSLRYVNHLHQHAWDGDSMGFFYTSTREIVEETRNSVSFFKSRIYYHELGTKQEKDVLLADTTDVLLADSTDAYGHTHTVGYLQNSARGDYLIVLTAFRDDNVEIILTLKIFNVHNISKDVRNLEGRVLKLQPIFTWRNHDDFIALPRMPMEYVGNVGELFYFIRAKDNLTMVEVNLFNSTEENWRMVIDADPTKKISGATAVDKDKVLVGFEKEDATEGKYLVELRFLKNGSLIRTFPFGIGGYYFGSLEDSEVQFMMSDNFQGLPEYTLLNVSDPNNSIEKLFDLTKLTSYDPSQFMTKLTAYPDTNGDVLKMTIIHKKDLKLDGTASVLIVFEDHVFTASKRTQYGLVHAKDFNTVVAYPRDPVVNEGAVIAAAEFLVKHGYGNASRIILQGISDSGLVGVSLSAAVNRRPDLFRALIFQISEHGGSNRFDMLKKHRPPPPSDSDEVEMDSEGSDMVLFRREFGVSPLHNIPLNRSGQFPGVFIGTEITSRLDGNIFIEHLEYKYIAELQATVGKTSRQANPFLLRIFRTKDVPGKDNDNFEEFQTDVICFLEKTMNYTLVN